MDAGAVNASGIFCDLDSEPGDVRLTGATLFLLGAGSRTARPESSEHEDVELRMSSGGGFSAKQFQELLGGRPGWRLEPRSTPGAGPLWCFVFNGKIEYSVEVQGGAIHLYVMDTDREIVFSDGDALMAWLRTNRAEAAQDPVAAPTWKSRRRRFTEWS